MPIGTAWVLNLDADLELEHGARYVPKGAILAAMRQNRIPLVLALLGPDDLLVDESTPPGIARDRVGLAFCPTPRALAALHRAGATPAPHPSFDVLRRVNGRAFAIQLGPSLPEAELVTTERRAREKLAMPPEVSDSWRLKRLFGMAGRGQRSVLAGPLSEHHANFLIASLAQDGAIVIEPQLAIIDEWAIHGMLDSTGELVRGSVVRQLCDAGGKWLATERVAPELVPALVQSALAAELDTVAAELARTGYFGPFGIDGFRYARGAETAIQPRSEINARVSMGWPIGMGSRASRIERAAPADAVTGAKGARGATDQ